MTKKLFSVLVLLTISSLSNAQTGCSCHELIWKDKEIQIFRLVIAPHTASLPFWHSDDYAFVPLTQQDTLEIVRTGETRSPYRAASQNANSWVTRDAAVRFVHPRQNEPAVGQVIYNGDDRSYVAIEILTKNTNPLPKFQWRVSMFGPASSEAQKLVTAAYSISFRLLVPLEQIKTETNTTSVIFANSPMTLEAGFPNVTKKMVSIGQAIVVGGRGIPPYRNASLSASRIVAISRPTAETRVLSVRP